MLSKIFICLILGYCFGCISTGYLVGKANNIDIRKYGSGNAGTTNALRTLGWKAGLITFLGDALKAIIPILLIQLVIFPGIEGIRLLMLYTGLGVVLGHNFPVWLSFKGGKGIAATGGVILAFDWRLALIALAVFVIIVGITRYVSLGSLVISILLPLWIIIFYPSNLHMIIVGAIYTILAFIKHRANIKRLISGTENKLGQKVKIDK